MINQLSHAAFSKKDASINKETNTLLSTSSQKDLGIGKSSQPGAQIFVLGGGGIERRRGSKPKLYLENTHRSFPRLQVLKNVPLSSTTIDASQENAEVHPHSLTIQLSPPQSTSPISSDVFMIDNMEISNSPSLKLMREPKIIIDTHHSEEGDLLEYQYFISSMVVDTVLENQTLISQQPSIDKSSTTIYSSMDSTSTSNPSTNTHYPLTTKPLMYIPCSSNPSLSDTVLYNLGTTCLLSSHLY